MAKLGKKTPVTQRGWLGSSNRTPWGRLPATEEDLTTSDPFEPGPPVNPDGSPMRIGPAAPVNPEGPAPLTPRELFEMLMTPPAKPSRASPAKKTAEPTVDDSGVYPAEADLVRSALEAGQAGRPVDERRSLPRRPYRVRATLRLPSDPAGSAPWALFTRDVHSRGLGFLTRHRLPLGYTGTVELPDPDGGKEPIQIACTLLRCREAAPGWFEGSLYFTREVPRLNEV